MKAIEGETYPELLSMTKSCFEKCKGFKPKASRSESVEMYVIGHSFKPSVSTSDATDEEAATPTRRRKPTGGWKR